VLIYHTTCNKSLIFVHLKHGVESGVYFGVESGVFFEVIFGVNFGVGFFFYSFQKCILFHIQK
jgi:hypothetical protein